MINITLREYDVLYSGECKCENTSKYHHISNEVFSKLNAFLREVTSKYSENNSFSKFIKLGREPLIGDTIQIRDYVGVISLSHGIQIEVLPKIDLSSDEDYSKNRLIVMKMIQSLIRVNSKNFTEANLHVRKMNILEIFISMYLDALKNLLAKGLKYDYENKEENLSCFKGKLLVHKNITYNLTHKERFFLSFDEYTENSAANRIIKTTILKLLQISNSQSNRKTVIHFLPYFDKVSVSSNLTKDFNKAEIVDRYHPEYSNIIDWSKVFLLNKGFTSFVGDHGATAILFDMNYLFEKYIATILKTEIERIYSDISLTIQQQKYWLFNHPETFKLKPDIVLVDKKNKESILIIDTKWKVLNSDNKSNYGISQEDMYQMYVYGMKYQVNEVWLIYPLNNDVKSIDKEIFYESTMDKTFRVRIKFFDLSAVLDRKLLREHISKYFLEINT